ncbi:5-methyltetrahydropteroyltriglutamate--homocysteine S-methyltransferase [Rapidithrix thailandica]|uniref:5-methyltetrahydropteroyltriglutamate--homocysteine methyltransferase n=1 Tax=Rapidithrix thailandica TaxID=413964 RepID=A0AAW9SH49_9BACT
MLKNNLGYPRIGAKRELKKACEHFWAGKISEKDLLLTAKNLRKLNWLTQQEAGIDLIPSNDFSFYDQVLDMSLMLGATPERFASLANDPLTLYFAMARGYQQDGLDLKALEMTKWFDTNYHYLVPEFTANQSFELFSTKAVDEFLESKALGIHTKPVLIGPVSYLLLGKEKEEGFHRLDLLDRLLPVYKELLTRLSEQGATWVQLDEPYLTAHLDPSTKFAYQKAYKTLRDAFPELKILLASYFAELDDPEFTAQLPVCAIHLDLVRAPQQLEAVLHHLPKETSLSLGVIDGRNIWKPDYQKVQAIVNKVLKKIDEQRILLAPSCSLLHVPYDLDAEEALSPKLKQWLSFAKQKLHELNDLHRILTQNDTTSLQQNQKCIEDRARSVLIHRSKVKERVSKLTEKDSQRESAFDRRQALQKEALQLPLFSTTTIGSFPQTPEIRKLRAQFKKQQLSESQYEEKLQQLTQELISWQEEAGLDVLVHGEYERNDMVEYFGEQLEGFAFTQYGWVQSYGSRCVKPPVLFGDVERTAPMTVKWSTFAQSLTNKPVKGMLTGPVTILQWSFVRDDQPRETTATQIALAIRDEVRDLEQAGIRVIQIDEPAFREGLPLRKEHWRHYLDWAVKVFKVASSGVEDQTQIHTHMCYSEFNDVMEDIAAMDADVITIETSRSQMELLDAFSDFHYPNEIGPGVYDIHSPRVPTVEEMVELLEKAQQKLPAENLWVNPDCGLKTRKWPETQQALTNMVLAAKIMRKAPQENRQSLQNQEVN